MILVASDPPLCWAWRDNSKLAMLDGLLDLGYRKLNIRLKFCRSHDAISYSLGRHSYLLARDGLFEPNLVSRAWST